MCVCVCVRVVCVCVWVGGCVHMFIKIEAQIGLLVGRDQLRKLLEKIGGRNAMEIGERCGRYGCAGFDAGEHRSAVNSCLDPV